VHLMMTVNVTNKLENRRASRPFDSIAAHPTAEEILNKWDVHCRLDFVDQSRYCKFIGILFFDLVVFELFRATRSAD
jgi:hypothetical protein